MLCQTAAYFQKVLVFQERTIGNSPLNWTDTLVLHFIGGNKWAVSCLKPYFSRGNMFDVYVQLGSRAENP